MHQNAEGQLEFDNDEECRDLFEWLTKTGPLGESLGWRDFELVLLDEADPAGVEPGAVASDLLGSCQSGFDGAGRFITIIKLCGDGKKLVTVLLHEMGHAFSPLESGHNSKWRRIYRLFVQFARDQYPPIAYLKKKVRQAFYQEAGADMLWYRIDSWQKKEGNNGNLKM